MATIKNLAFEGASSYVIKDFKVVPDFTKITFNEELREVTMYTLVMNVPYLSISFKFNEDYTSCKTCMVMDDIDNPKKRKMMLSYDTSVDSKVKHIEIV